MLKIKGTLVEDVKKLLMEKMQPTTNYIVCEDLKRSLTVTSNLIWAPNTKYKLPPNYLEVIDQATFDDYKKDPNNKAYKDYDAAYKVNDKLNLFDAFNASDVKSYVEANDFDDADEFYEKCGDPGKFDGSRIYGKREDSLDYLPDEFHGFIDYKNKKKYVYAGYVKKNMSKITLVWERPSK